MIQLAIAGVSGRMGQAVLDLASRDDRFAVAAALAEANCPTCGTIVRVRDLDLTIADKLLTPCDVLIDFTVASGTLAWLEICERAGTPMIIGATGHDEAQLAQIDEASRTIPIVKAANFAIGVSALTDIAVRLARQLGDDYDIEVVETHHRHKIDAPSGTALAIVDEILRATGRTRDEHVVFGRHGETGERPQGQIGVHAIRLGETVGHHEIQFSGHGESITVRHAVDSRQPFAAGALRAAAWVINRPPGLYTMRDVMS